MEELLEGIGQWGILRRGCIGLDKDFRKDIGQGIEASCILEEGILRKELLVAFDSSCYRLENTRGGL